MELAVKAYAKVNLTLEVLGRRPDGYHELRMLMQPLALHDDVILTSDQKLSVETIGDGVPAGEHNLAYRAVVALARLTGVEPKVSIRITKRIPVAAGLAGGSADAAAVLRGLDRLWGLNLPGEDLSALALMLGSDVPFCLLNQTALAEGRGERLTPLPPLPSTPVVTATPRVSWPGPKTATVFSHYRPQVSQKRPNHEEAIRAVRSGDIATVTKNMVNALEPTVVSMHPVIADLRAALLRAGAQGVMMTGAGPTVLAIASSLQERRRLAQVAGQYTDLVVETEFLA